MKKLWNAEKKDLTLPALLAAGLLLLCAKLFLSGAQSVFLWPEEAILDDMAMYNGAVSITEGGWLGGYGAMTLAKHSFFSLWLAGLHAAGVPYLLGGQLLWAGAALAAAWAFAPALGRRLPALALFAALLFCPSSTANPAPMGFVTRVYRDNIFPALCVLCVAGMVGFCLRYGQRLRLSAGWPVLAGAAFAACRLCREDGLWPAPFVAGAAIVCLCRILFGRGLRGGTRAKLSRVLALLAVPALLLAGELAWRAANGAVYGRFIVSDFSEGEFADAYGAMTRIEHADWKPDVAVPRDVRELLYEKLPAFAPLRAYLDESESYKNRYTANGEYQSGAFYWALREAAAELGVYDTPESARAYFARLAADINALCDTGEVRAGARRSGVSPPIRAEYILPVAREAAYSLYFCATFQQCDARSLFSPHGNDAGFYEETLKPMEEFLRERAHTVTRAGSSEPYYTFRENICFKALDALRTVYAVLLPAGLLAALVWLCAYAARRGGARGQGALWWMLLGVLLCVLLRAGMIAFAMVSSFGIDTYVMYLASIHPLMIIFAYMGTFMLARGVWLRRGARRAAGGAA